MASSRVGARTKSCGAFRFASIFIKKGIENAAVLPLPVCAIPNTSLPANNRGIHSVWIGDGLLKPRSFNALRISSDKPRSIKEISFVM